MSLWHSDDPDAWHAALAAYPAAVHRRGGDKLAALDAWYREELPPAARARSPMHVTRDELVRATEWKMRRGVWRPRNLVLVKNNSDEDVRAASEAAFVAGDDARAAVQALARLGGVGPATASSLLAAARPETYAFFDEEVAAAAGMGEVLFKLPEYLRYRDLLSDKARRLGAPWTPQSVGLALWATHAA